MIRKPQSLKQALQGVIPAQLFSTFRSSFDVIGTIAVLEIPKEIEPYERDIAKVLLAINPTVKTVCKKLGGHQGRFRRQKMKILGGVRTKQTIHTENGVRLKVQVEDAYFSPRLATERLRIARMVNPNETVLVMFSGIAPYPLTIAKHSNAKLVMGIELNPKAHAMAVENNSLNKNIKVPINLVQGNVKKVIPSLHQVFDRIIMPLPKGGEAFFDQALQAAKKRSVIHYYTFCEEDEIPTIADTTIRQIQQLGRQVTSIGVTKCGQSGVRQFRVCIDLQLF